MHREFTADEKALVSLLDEKDEEIVQKVSQALTRKGLYGILLLNANGIHISSLDDSHPAVRIVFSIIKSELQSELSSGGADLEKFLYILSFMENDFFPFVEITEYLNQLAARIEARLDGDKSVFRKLDILNEVFFAEEKFSGNTEDYYNINNSLIIEVIRRKKGIPLSLSIIYMAVASRINLKLQGLPFPGHFMCKFAYGRFSGAIDVFNGGRLLSYSEAHWFLASMGHNLDVEKFPITNIYDIILRTLKNMENVYKRQEQNKKMETIEAITQLVEKNV